MNKTVRTARDLFSFWGQTEKTCMCMQTIDKHSLIPQIDCFDAWVLGMYLTGGSGENDQFIILWMLCFFLVFYCFFFFGFCVEWMSKSIEWTHRNIRSTIFVSSYRFLRLAFQNLNKRDDLSNCALMLFRYAIRLQLVYWIIVGSE